MTMDSMPVVITLPDAKATYALGHYLGQQLPVGTVILLTGDLGSGKTTLVKHLGAGLGITEPMRIAYARTRMPYSNGRGGRDGALGRRGAGDMHVRAE